MITIIMPPYATFLRNYELLCCQIVQGNFGQSWYLADSLSHFSIDKMLLTNHEVCYCEITFHFKL